MNDTLVALLIGLLAAPLASFFTWSLNRKKSTTDILSSITEAGQAAVESVTSALEVVNHQLEEVRKENVTLHNDICELKEQNKQLIRENEALRKDLMALKRQNDTLMEQIHDMRVAYETNNNSSSS
jgi:septal ring factor EnvC (AmiA/AmiB activator)